jgi:hypothetical protein
MVSGVRFQLFRLGSDFAGSDVRAEEFQVVYKLRELSPP